MKYLIVGLGNIGIQYTYTRHNIGFRILDNLAQRHSTTFTPNKLAYTSHIKHRGRHIYLLKPTTNMNLSGQAVRYWHQKLQIPTQRLLIITDDIHLPLSTLRLRSQGSSGGHNGIANIEQKLGHKQFPRLRCGIDKNFPPGQQTDYVLQNFTPQEAPKVHTMITHATAAAEAFCLHDINHVMRQHNRPQKTPPPSPPQPQKDKYHPKQENIVQKT